MIARPAVVHVGYEVGTGKAVDVPVLNLAVTGMTQQAGKTTALEALVSRAGVTALAFITKRGESAFATGHRIQPYFRDRADWQFVTSIIDATLQEKNKFLRPWIMKICRTTHSLADVHKAVKAALVTARAGSLNEGVYTQLDEYLELIVPEIRRAKLATELELVHGRLQVMDVSSFATPMQMLFIQSALDWVNEHETDTVIVIPEAWEMIPEGKGSPVKASATTLVRKGSGIHNHIWVDSQDMAGVDKLILRGCPVWIIGVQREANEIKRNLANIPKGVARPTAADVATLARGQFYVCHGTHAVKTYVQPAWMPAEEARLIALGAEQQSSAPRPRAATPPAPSSSPTTETTVNEARARELERENETLRRRVEQLERQLRPEALGEQASLADAPSQSRTSTLDADGMYQQIKERLLREPKVLRLLAEKPTIDVVVERKTIEVDGATPKGRIAQLLARGWFDNDGSTQGATRTELRRTGTDVNTGTISTVFKGFVKDGFLTVEGSNLYRAVPGMKVNIVEH